MKPYLILSMYFLINFKNIQFSMKKSQAEYIKLSSQRKKQSMKSLSPPKKQFQLLYRERDHQPSSGAYQSIFFMKSKKCDNNKSSHSKQKNDLKSKKQSVQQLTKMVVELQKKLKSENQRVNRKLEQNSKNRLAKTATSTNNLFNKKEMTEVKLAASSNRWPKYKKLDSNSTNLARKYKNILSPSRKIRSKEMECQYAKLTKNVETVRKQTIVKPKRKTKKENINPLENQYEYQPSEYIFLQNNFVGINKEEVKLLSEKIIFSKREAKPSFDRSSTANQIHFPEQQSEESDYGKQGKYLNEDANQKQSYHKNSSLNDSGLFEREQLKKVDLEVVEKFILSKIKFIQRWWRSLLKKNNCQHDNLNPIRFSTEEQRVIFLETQFDESLIFCNDHLVKQIQVSPIKLIDDMNLEDQPLHEGDYSIYLRESAALNQLNTHKQLLEKLFMAGKINETTYYTKRAMIQNKYNSQLREIQQIKKILQENANKVQNMTEKLKQDVQKMDKIQAQVDSKTLDQVFGKESSNSKLLQEKKIMEASSKDFDTLIVNRQKSTGCHYASEQKNVTHYQKNIHTGQQYQEDFQEQDSEENCQRNVHVQQSYNANYQELLDQYKIRQEVQMEIDRRAAIQMGVLVEDIPPEIRNEYVGIDTSLNSIHRLLLSFFKFYIFYYKDEFLRLINMPYGHNIAKRIKLLQGYEQEDVCPQEDEDGIIYGLESIISSEVLDQFYDKVYDIDSTWSTARKANLQFQKMHNKVLIDSFNEALNFFRPYYLINGAPYPWNNSQKSLTFYFIAEENIQQVFEKTQFKVLKWASSLCGIMVNQLSNACPQASGQTVQDSVERYGKGSHPALTETREDRLNKNEKVQIIQNNHQWAIFEEERTFLNLITAEYIFGRMLEQFQIELKTICHLQQSGKCNQLSQGFMLLQDLEEYSSSSDL